MSPSSSRSSRDLLLEVIGSRMVAVAFQPILDLNDGMIVAYEALTRVAPDSGFANPSELFQAAATEGLLWELESITRTASILAASSWPSDTRLFLNTTPVVFADKRFPDAVQGAMNSAVGLTPDRIVLEITELSDEQNFPGLAEQVQRMKELGFAAAIDDAGAGTSGLNRIMILRPTWIKLDREFVRGIDKDHYKQNLVRFFVHFARLSGVSVIGEGVETKAELATVIGLGVRYAQGYYLGRPGTREQTTDARFVSEVRGRWADVDAAAAPSPASASLAKLCQPVLTVEAEATIEQTAMLLRGDESLAGAVIRDGRRVTGWASRAVVLERSGKAPRPLREIARGGMYQLPPSATIQESLELACLLEEETIADPLVVTSGASVIGIVRVRDLLRAAAQEGRLGQSWRAPVTGLPARIRADQHIVEMVRLAGDSEQRGSPSLHADAAFVDIRAFADYNAAFGYELGDRLIRSLSDMISSTVIGPLGEAFLAHLGEDRFLLTGPAGQLEARLNALMELFDRQASLLPARGLVGPADGFAPGLPCPRMALRVLMMPGVFHRISQPRDLYRLEQQLRAVAGSRSARPSSSGSSMITDWRRDAQSQRKIA